MEKKPNTDLKFERDIDEPILEPGAEQCPSTAHIYQAETVEAMKINQFNGQNAPVPQLNNPKFQPVREEHVLQGHTRTPFLPNENLTFQDTIPANYRNRTKQSRSINFRHPTGPTQLISEHKNIIANSMQPNYFQTWASRDSRHINTQEPLLTHHMVPGVPSWPMNSNLSPLLRNPYHNPFWFSYFARPENAPQPWPCYPQQHFAFPLYGTTLPTATYTARRSALQQLQHYVENGIYHGQTHTHTLPRVTIILENYFKKYPYPTRQAKIQLSEILGVTTQQVTSWFHSRRMKQKREQCDAASTRQTLSASPIPTTSTVSSSANTQQQLIQVVNDSLTEQVKSSPRAIPEEATVTSEAANTAIQRQERQTLISVAMVAPLAHSPTNPDLQDSLNSSVRNLENPTLKPKVDQAEHT